MDDQGPWKNRIVGQGEQPASQFVAHPDNWRIHPPEQRAAMHAALTEVGWVQRVVVNRRTGYLIDGHERVWQALANGDATVPFIEVDLDEAEEAYVLATLDPIGAMAHGDQEKLDELLAAVETDSAAIGDMLAGLTGNSGASGADRELEEIDLDKLPVKPVWVLCAMPTEMLPEALPHLQALEALGVRVEVADG